MDRLKAVGVSAKAAREHAAIAEELVSEMLVTKRDLRELELRMKLYNAGLAATIVGVLAALKYFG